MRRGYLLVGVWLDPLAFRENFFGGIFAKVAKFPSDPAIIVTSF